MLERAREHPRDDLHVAVGMGVEAAPRRHAVVIDDAQAAEPVPLRIAIISERKCVPTVEPVDISMAARRGRADRQHGSTPFRQSFSWKLPVSTGITGNSSGSYTTFNFSRNSGL